MISWSPIWAVTLRHLRLYRRDPNLPFMIFYWPFLDILTWGFLGAWIQQSGIAQFQNYELVALLGVLLWQIAGRGANAVSFALCEEIWQNNIINLFSLPIRMIEWVMGTILYFTFMVLTVGITNIACIYAFYDLPLAELLYNYILFFPPLFFCGIWLGFTCVQIIIVCGKRGIELAFVTIWFLLPFSGAYYPLEVLPAWGQRFAALFPLSYIFTGMRNYLMHGQNPGIYLVKGYIMSIAYAMFAIALFIYLFNRSKQKGLARLTD